MNRDRGDININIARELVRGQPLWLCYDAKRKLWGDEFQPIWRHAVEPYIVKKSRASLSKPTRKMVRMYTSVPSIFWAGLIKLARDFFRAGVYAGIWCGYFKVRTWANFLALALSKPAIVKIASRSPPKNGVVFIADPGKNGQHSVDSGSLLVG